MQVNTVLPPGITVPIGWVAVGDPAQIYPPGHAATLRYLAMDLSATYRSGAPAGATLVADAVPCHALNPSAGIRCGCRFHAASLSSGEPECPLSGAGKLVISLIGGVAVPGPGWCGCER